MNDWWQANKRFAVLVASGAIVFLIGLMLVDRFFTQDLKANQATWVRARNKLANEKLYSTEQLAELQRENTELATATATLQQAVAFVPRPAFRHEPGKGAVGNQYFQTVSSVREDLLTLAGRASMRLPEELGLPALSPTREPEIVRYLEALDLVDRAVRMALAAGVDRIDKIDVKLDPKLTSRGGVGPIERTRVAFVLSGRPTPLVQFLQLSQAEKDGGPLLLDKCDMQPTRARSDEAGLEVTFVVARLGAP
jgi:hypothetical protein